MVFKRATARGKNRSQEPKISIKKLTVKNQKSQFVSSTQINLRVHHKAAPGLVGELLGIIAAGVSVGHKTEPPTSLCCN